MTDVDSAKLAMKAFELAAEYDRKYGSCPQCVIAAVQETLGEISDTVFKASHALAGGGGLCGDGTCGALTGGMVALSAKFGREKKDFATKNPKAFKLSKKLHDRFVEEYGSPICREVQRKIMGKPFDMWNPGDYSEFEKLGGHTDKCPHVAGNVASWVVELLLEGECGK